MVYSGRIVKLRVRGTKRDLRDDASVEEFCVVMPGVIARFDVSDIKVNINFFVHTIGVTVVLDSEFISKTCRASLYYE